MKNYSPSPMQPITMKSGTMSSSTLTVSNWAGESFVHGVGSKDLLRSLWHGEQGQDLIEYSLLLAFVCLSGAAMFIGMGTTTSALWGIVNSRLAAANQAS
jgi:Flp pilus assembly pilin Flp